MGWAFRLQAAFVGFVFIAGMPLNATLRYRKLWQPLNYILVNVSGRGRGDSSSASSGFTIFMASC